MNSRAQRPWQLPRNSIRKPFGINGVLVSWIRVRSAHGNSFDHLVGAAREGQRHGNAERLGGLEVEDQLDLRGLLHRQVSGLLAPENAPGVETGQTVRLLAHQTAGGGELAQKIDCWDAVAEGECAELRGVTAEQRIGAADHERGYSQLRRRCEGCFEVGFGARVDYMKPHAECIGYGLQVFRDAKINSLTPLEMLRRGSSFFRRRLLMSPSFCFLASLCFQRCFLRLQA